MGIIECCNFTDKVKQHQNFPTIEFSHSLFIVIKEVGCEITMKANHLLSN